MREMLTSLFENAEQEAVAKQKQNDQQKASDIEMHRGVLVNPQTAPEQRTKAADEIAKLRGMKKGDSSYHRLADILNQVGKHLASRKGSPGQSQQPAEGAAAPSAAPPEGQQGQGLTPLSPQAPSTSGGIVKAAVDTQPPDPQREQQDAQTKQIQEKTEKVGGGMLSKIGHGLGEGLHALDTGLRKAGQAYEKTQPGKMIDSYTGSDGKRREIFQRADGSTYEKASESTVSGTGTGKKIDSYTGADGKKHDIFQRPDGSTYEAASTGDVKDTGSVRPVYGPPMSVRNARELAKQGTEFTGEDGKPIDIANLPDDMGLKRFTMQGKTVWVPFSPNQKVVTVGNEEYSISPMDVGSLTDGAGTDLGQHNVGTTTVPGYTGIDSSGAIQRVPGQRTPGTTGVKKNQGLTPLDTPKTAGSGKNGTSKTSGAPKGKDLPLPISSYGKQADRATGVHLAQAALKQFSDDDLSVFDNPDSVEKLKNIIGYIQKTAEQQVGTGTGPMAAVETWAGLPTAMNQLQQQLLQDQSIQLDPKEQQFLADYFYLLGSWPGMRKSVGTSPAKWSMQLMFSELPTPGLVNSSAEAKRRLANMEKETKQVVIPKQLQGLDGETDTPDAGDSKVIYARDPQGKRHQAKAGTPLPKGWTLENAQAAK